MESDLSATNKNTREQREEKFLGNKRDNRVLKDNYLFRRILTGKVAGKYENLANTFYNMMAFNWDEERLLKLRSNIMGNLNAMAVWFYICSNYFPYCSNQYLEVAGGVPEMLKKVLEKVISNKRVLKKKSHLTAKCKFVDDVKSFFEIEEEVEVSKHDGLNEEIKDLNVNLELNSDKVECVEGKAKEINNIPHDAAHFFKGMPTDDIISNLSGLLNQLTQKNSRILTDLIKKLSAEDKFLCSFDNEFAYDQDELLLDMKYENVFTEQFKQYLVRKHESDTERERTGDMSPKVICESKQSKQHFILTRAEEEMNSNPDDIVCLICNDGDYEDNDLIVYCSSCQMTVHQSCYGIITLPKEDWICYPCLAFGQERYKEVQCVLCPVKGGAMKPCNIKKSSQVYSILMKMRSSTTQGANGGFFCNGQSEVSSNKFKIALDIEKASLNYNNNCENNLNGGNLLNDVKEVSEKGSINELENVKPAEENKNPNENPNEIPNENPNANPNENIKPIDVDLETPPSDSNFIATTPKATNPQNTTAENETNKQTFISLTNYSTERKRGRQKKFKKKDRKQKYLNASADKTNIELVNTFNEFINQKIANENAWVHLSCALWLPEVTIADFPRKEEIKGIESIEKKRFQEFCSICKLTSYGPTVKCENEKCSLRFHVECARINKYLLEKVNNYSGELKFYIYCQTHRPHRLIKNIELCRQRTIDDIVIFGDTLKKNYEILTKIDKRYDFSVFIPRRYGLTDTFKKRSSIFGDLTQFEDFIQEDKKGKKASPSFSGKDKSNIIKRVREIILSMSNLSVKITQGENNHNSVVPYLRSSIRVRYEDTLNIHKFPWYLLKGATKFFPNEVFNYYVKDLVPSEDLYNKIILKRSKQKKLKMKKKSKEEAVAEEEFMQSIYCPSLLPLDPNIYCYCKQRDTGEQMIGCYYGESDENPINKCINNGWVHKDCVEELRNLDKDTIEAEDFIFACKECIQAYGDPILK